MFLDTVVALYGVAVVLENPESRKVKLNWFSLRPFVRFVDTGVERFWLVILWSPRVHKGSVVVVRELAVHDRLA